MPNRSGKRYHDQNKRWLEKTDGNYCLICKGEGITRGPPEHPLDIHHARTDLADSDPAYWAPEDICLACTSCNLSLRYKKAEELRFIIRHYRARNVRAREREREGGSAEAGLYTYKETIMDRVDFTQGSPEMRAKSHYEPLFCRFVLDRITEFTTYPEKEMLDEFFNRTKASQTTTKRYLDGYCSSEGFYRRKKIDGIWRIAFKYPLHPERLPKGKVEKCPKKKESPPGPATSAAAGNSGSAPAGAGPSGSARAVTPPRRTASSTGGTKSRKGSGHE